MKKVEVNEQGVRQEITRTASGMPYALAGAVFFLVAGTNSLCSLSSYIWPVVAAVIAFKMREYAAGAAYYEGLRGLK